jgi:ABC-type branched-subunit amino acid transport system substrate-binding protein
VRWISAVLTRIVSVRSGAHNGLAFAARASVAALGLFVLAACTTTGTSTPAPQRVENRLPEPNSALRNETEQPLITSREAFIRPAHMAGQEPVRVALLLPLGDTSPQARAIADSMRNAAELAVFRSGRTDLLLLTKDTRGTVPGAQEAARSAITEGAEIILGPLFANNVEAITPIARQAGLSVIAFSSDSQVADSDVYLLGFTPEQEVTRVAEYAMSQGYFEFATMIPRGDYGNRVDAAFSNTVSRYGGYIVQTVPYDRNAEDFRNEASILAHTYGTGSMRRYDQDGAALGAENMVPDQPGFTAVLLPEGGTALRLLAPSLPYNDIDNRVVRFLGTGLWDDQRLWREPALNHGWFAAPDPERRARFRAAFENIYGEAPHRLASLAYDAVTLAATLSDAPYGQRYTRQRLTTPSGFAGVDGIFRFRQGGGTDRGLAVLEVDNGSVDVVSPAPDRFGAVDDDRITPADRRNPPVSNTGL